jgi:hypothetical protein
MTPMYIAANIILWLLAVGVPLLAFLVATPLTGLWR